MRRILIPALLLLATPTVFAGTLCGHVTDEVSGQPIHQAGVFVHQSGIWTGDHASTDIDGLFFLDLPAGTYSLQVRVDDHVDGWLDGIVVTDTSTNIDMPIPLPAVTLAAPWPNPAAGSTKLRLTVNRTTDLELTVHDARGRIVRRWTATGASPGELVHDWNGRDHAGRAVTEGIYLIRARAGGDVVTRKVMLVR